MSAVPATQPTTRFLQWIRPPQQERTRQSLTRLLDAAESLIAAKGIDDAGIVDIARAAGSSVGSFYRRFRDKDTLLQALHERFCEEAIATAQDALDPHRWTGAAVPEIVHEFAAFLVEIYREREGFFRAILARGPADPTMRARTNQLFDEISTHLHTLLDARAAEITHPDPVWATRFGLHAMLGTLNHMVQVQPASPRLADDRVGRELARSFLAYVGAEIPQERSHPPSRRSSR